MLLYQLAATITKICALEKYMDFSLQVLNNFPVEYCLTISIKVTLLR